MCPHSRACARSRRRGSAWHTRRRDEMGASDEPAVVGDGVASVTRGDVIVSLWVAPASAPRWRSVVFAELSRLAERCPEGVVLVQVILSTSSPPDMKTRAAVQGDLRSLGPRLRGVI